MPGMNRREWLTSLAALGVAGCARFAVRPPTPAATMDTRGMWEPRPDEKFYILIFGSQSKPKVASRTHTWLVVVRAPQHGEIQGPEIEYHTISWLPITTEVHPLTFRVEKGVNWSLHETLQIVLKNQEQISEWGPYECRPRLYYRTVVQKEFLDSGVIGYQAIDDIGESARKGNGCDCIHSFTDQDPLFSRSRYPLRRFGDSASQFIVKQVWERDLLILPEQTHDWLQEPLGLNPYPITRRCYRGRVDDELARRTRESSL